MHMINNYYSNKEKEKYFYKIKKEFKFKQKIQYQP